MRFRSSCLHSLKVRSAGLALKSNDRDLRVSPWRRKWQPTPVFLPRESHGQRSQAGYGPWGCKNLDTTERLTNTENVSACMSACVLDCKEG